MKNVVFTICAKNYLAQALVLRESTLKHNDVDFFIFLADNKQDIDVPNLVELDNSWIPNWKSMAFKYNVIEFNTSIKPFCFQKLFNDGYEKVVYIDPDIYVLDSLDYVFTRLDDHSIVLTPHRCLMLQDYEGVTSEESCLGFGIYNLGFAAIRQDSVGKNIVSWWCKRLADKCYMENMEALFVDQKWMDFIPCFYPNDVLISHNLGLNVAEWNLQERKLVQTGNKWQVVNKLDSNDVYPLVFFHFSSYSPLIPERLDKRNGSITTATNPELNDLISQYRESLLRNHYDSYTKYSYSFNTFNNNEEILPLQRRLYREKLSSFVGCDDPFDIKSEVYNVFNSKGLLSHVHVQSGTGNSVVKKQSNLKSLARVLHLVKRILGVKRYSRLISACRVIGDYKFHSFLIEN